MMPELNGWGVLTELKADPSTADIPVVMLTSVGKSDVGFALGAVDFLVKPVPADRLAAVLRRHCRPESARVLVVDDDDAGRAHVRRKLETAGHTVVEAADGQQGLEAMLATTPDLVLLDLMMPVLDGFAVLQRMRHTPALEDVPVVVVTAKDLSAAERTMLTGARAVLERGAHPRDELVDVVSDRVADLLGV
jgi:CheY-like chemotaxis protein